jgi:flagella basal body P-ring formation protein FlgA
VIFRSKFNTIVVVFFFALSTISFGESFHFLDQIKGRFLGKVLRDYPMLVTQDIRIAIQSEPYLAGMIGDCVSLNFSFADRSDVMGRTLVPISFLDSHGQVKQKINVVVDVDASAIFVRTKGYVKRNEVLTNQNTEEVVLPLKGYNKSHLLARKSYLNKQAVSTLIEGTVLATWMFDDVPLIRNSDRVKVVMQKPGYILDVKGVALEDGKKGQKIRVQLETDSRKTLQCEVVNETTVRYQGMY